MILESMFLLENIHTNPQEEPLRDLQGFPGVKPPWGTLTALNLNNGKILWQVPLGYYEVLKTKGNSIFIDSKYLN